MKYYFVWVLVSFISVNLFIPLFRTLYHSDLPTAKIFTIKDTSVLSVILIGIVSLIPFLNIIIGVICSVAYVGLKGVLTVAYLYDKYGKFTLNDAITKVKNNKKSNDVNNIKE